MLPSAPMTRRALLPTLAALALAACAVPPPPEMPSQPAPAAQPETPPATPDTHPIPPYSAAMEGAWRTEFARETEKRYGIPRITWERPAGWSADAPVTPRAAAPSDGNRTPRPVTDSASSTVKP